MMRLEPWCFAPDVIARMTDYEIAHEHLWPQMRRQESQERARKGLPDASQVDESFVPSRQFMIGTLMAIGMSKDAAIAEYDRQKLMDDELKAKKKAR